MKDSLNSNTLFNTVAMMRPECNSLILVAEGDDDCFVLQRHKSPDLEVVNGVGGKSSVLVAAELAVANSVSGVVFLVDADYDRIVDIHHDYPSNVIPSVRHDFFMDIVFHASHVVEQVIETHTRAAPRRGRIHVDASRIHEQAMQLATQVAPFRIVNAKKDLGLRLSNFPFGAVRADPAGLREFAEVIIGRSNTGFSTEDLLIEISSEESLTGVADVFLVGDHDYFGALARVLDREDLANVKPEVLFSSFLAAIRCTELMSTEWHSSLSDWAADYDRSAFACPC